MEEEELDEYSIPSSLRDVVQEGHFVKQEYGGWQWDEQVSVRVICVRGDICCRFKRCHALTTPFPQKPGWLERRKLSLHTVSKYPHTDLHL